MNADDSRQLCEIAERLSALSTTNHEEEAMLGFLVGAVYALDRAIRIDFIDRTGKKLPSDYKDEVRLIALQLAKSSAVDEKQWLAGFYLNSALHRLSAVNEVFMKLSKRHDKHKVRQEVNKLKHELGTALSRRTVLISEAVRATNDLTALLETLTERTTAQE